jgi:hypothetical protein
MKPKALPLALITGTALAVPVSILGKRDDVGVYPCSERNFLSRYGYPRPERRLRSAGRSWEYLGHGHTVRQ